MPTKAVENYEAAVAAERTAFQLLQQATAGTSQYGELKDLWIRAIRTTEVARAAMLKVWGVTLDGDRG